MNGVEAAASLFGPEEPSSDPFSILGSPTAQPEIPESSNLFNDHEASVLLGRGSNEAGNDFFNHPVEEPIDAIHRVSSPASHNVLDSMDGSSEAQMLHGTTQSHQYENHEYSAHMDDNSSVKGPYDSPSDSYTPAPSIPQSNVLWYSNPTSDPYAPPAPSAIQPARELYSTYPVQHNSYSISAIQQSTHSSVSIQSGTPLTPASPPVTQAINRPRVLNAYDPPFPTTSSRRPGRLNGHQTYGAYSAYHSNYSEPPATVPPSTYTTAQVASQTGYPSSGYSNQSVMSGPVSMNQYSSHQQHPSNGHQSAQPSVNYHPEWQPYTNTNYAQVPAVQSNIPSSQGPDLPSETSLTKGRSDASLYEPHAESVEDNIWELGSPPHSYSQAYAHQASVHNNNFTVIDSLHSSPSSHLPDNGIVSHEKSSLLGQHSHRPPFAAVTHSYQASVTSSQPINTPDSSPYQFDGIHNSQTQQKHTESVDPDPYAPKSTDVSFNYEKRTHSPGSIQNGWNERSSITNMSVSPSNADELNVRYTSLSNESLYNAPPQTVPYSSSQSAHEGQYGQTTMQLQEISRVIALKYNSTLPSLASTASSMVYAPSPSLLGSDDPLTRTTARSPVISFGFGGQLVTCFHGATTLNTGFDVALSSRSIATVKIHVLNRLIPESALGASTAPYPGPLFCDPGNPTTGLVRPAASTQTKTKRVQVLKYLDDRISEISQGLGYQGRDERQTSEAKLVLIKLLKIMVENDGQLLGSSQSDTAVRLTLVPRLDGNMSSHASNSVAPPGFSTIITESLGVNSELSPVIYSVGIPIESSETPISVSTLKPSSLNKIEDFLIRGERRKAYSYALGERLWAHAMVIASSIDKDAWKEVVNDFIRNELTSKDDSISKSNGDDCSIPPANTRESLRIAYRLFSGQGTAAVQELLPTNLLSRATGRLQSSAVMMSQTTPKTPQFSVNVQVSSPPEALWRWRETVAMIISSPLTLEASAALTALGDQLLSFNWVEAAHACYLLSPQTSPLGGMTSPGARITLLGCRSPLTCPSFSKDSDLFIFSEILEFALSLAPVSKGQEAFSGLAHLQPYRLIRATSIAELGDLQLANRYCEAVLASLGRNSPYFIPIFVEQVRGLSERIAGVSHSEKSGSWIGGKLSKPSLDTIGGWLEGRFTKLVTGDGDAPSPSDHDSRTDQRSFAGPFAHYSTISTTPSARSSPQPTASASGGLPQPHRTASAMAVSSPYLHHPIDRASSATDYLRNGGSPSLPTSPSINPPYPHPNLGLNTMNGSRNSSGAYSPDATETPVQGSTWWNSSSSTAQTPTASTFMKVDQSAIQANSDGFISLMDNQSYAIRPPSPAKSKMQQVDTENDDEDLGLGNKKDVSHEEDAPKNNPEPSSTKSEESQKKPEATSSSGSWLSKWWKGETSGPIKASLGEESAFYYDKDLKRWVNKKTGPEESLPNAPPPPPSRAQTVSPGKAATRIPAGTGPPLRSSSAMEFGLNPDSGGLRIRSNLVPPPETAPSTPTGSRVPSSMQGLPPPGRPRSQAAKRNIRSRYVDVFQQENVGA